MMRGENSESIPTDLIIEILSRLPAKSIPRFRCVSKLWASIIHSLHCQYFTELFLTRSLARPLLLFIVQRADEWCIFTSPQPHEPYGKSSLVRTANFHMKFPRELLFHNLISGLMYIRHKRISEEDNIDIMHGLCNPSTGQYVSFSNVVSIISDSKSYLGFDPVDKQFKVLSINNYQYEPFIKILTLETEKASWRKILCPLHHSPWAEWVCINGVLYYLARVIIRSHDSDLVVCFDIRSENFKFIEFICRKGTKLINYMGKLGGITWQTNHLHGSKCNCVLSMWVLEDVEKQEWSHYSKTFWEGDKIFDYNVKVVGVTDSGEIVLSMDNPFQPFYVFYYNFERKTLHYFEVRGFGATHEALENIKRVKVFVNHVEDFNFIK